MFTELDATMASESRLLPAETLFVRGVALTHVALRGAGEVTRLAAETHATIARAPLPWRRDATAPARLAPFPYRIVSHSFLLLARMAGMFLHNRIPAPQSGPALLFHSALNGVCGDKLEEWNNPLAQPMQFCNEHGQPLGSDWVGEHKRAVIFVHGLCLSEQQWQTSEHRTFVSELRAQGHAVAWLRYNSGRPIHANGRALQRLLSRQFAEGKTRLTLVGHSMGGLVIRAACHEAMAQQSPWIERLQHAAYLGTPHHGAPLERAGNGLNNLLAITPYTKPFMRLGNVRSQGIRDLRHGHFLPPEAHNGDTGLATHTSHLLLAGSLHDDTAVHWLGDGLVPVKSALGEHQEADRTLRAPHLDRREIGGLGHMAMLGDARVYSVLRDWMGMVH